MPDSTERPTYDLAEFKRLVASGPFGYRIEAIAFRGAGELELEEQDIIDCVLALDGRKVSDGGHFYKSMESETRPGMFHDVYKPTHHGLPIYCKLQIMVGRRGDTAAIISFKRDKSR